MENVFELDDYRETLQRRVKALRQKRPGLTWKKIAAQIPVQYTFLSKALNSETTHLNEDHLFIIGKYLEFFPEEIDFLTLQRAYAVAQDKSRRDYLYKKIEAIRRRNKTLTEDRSFNSAAMLNEMSYLFEPYSVVVHAALTIPAFQKDPRKLCGLIGISVPKLREILTNIANVGFIELDEDGMSVKKLNQTRLHFGRDHALMRHHQNLLKNQLQSRLTRTDEADKQSFLITFVMDDPAFEEVKEQFQAFLKKTELIARSAKGKRLCQLSFDLFKWF